MGKKTVRKIELTEEEITTRLNALVPDLAAKKILRDETAEAYEDLRKDAFPLVEALGGTYVFQGIKVQIVEPKKWQVDAVKLLKKFGGKIYHMLTVSVTVFKEDFERGALGTADELKVAGIAKMVDDTPRLIVTPPKKKTKRARRK